MPRHNLKKYDPASESSKGLEKEAKEHSALCLNTKTRTIGEGEKAKQGSGCPCGCEGEPVGAKRIFLMGHDARLRGRLIRAHLTQTKVRRFVDGKFHHEHSAAQDAKAFGESFTKALKEAEQRRHTANQKLVHEAMNSERLVKVGRWKYTGQVVAVFSTPKGEEYEIKYVDKQGKTAKIRVPASKAPPVAEAQPEAAAA